MPKDDEKQDDLLVFVAVFCFENRWGQQSRVGNDDEAHRVEGVSRVPLYWCYMWMLPCVFLPSFQVFPAATAVFPHMMFRPLTRTGIMELLP